MKNIYQNTQIPNKLLKTINNNFQINEILENPYVLTDLLTWEQIEAIAHNIKMNDFDNNDSNRLTSSIIKAFENYSKNGHTLINRNMLIKESIRLSKVSKYILEQTLDELIKRGYAKEYGDSVSIYPYFEMEEYIYEIFLNYSNKENTHIMNDKDLEKFMESEELKLGFSLSNKQRDIIHLANKRYPIFSLSGFGGAGKTTSSQSVLNLFSKIYDKDKIICCALSGVASSRAKKITGYESKTIHSLLSALEGNIWNKNSADKLDYSLIMLDESSMVDTSTFYRLLKAIDFNKTTLLKVGDFAQLQSVGCGDIYKNILENNLCSNITLDKVYRQREDQVINIFAQSIRQAKIPNNYKEDYEDFEFVEQNDIEAIESFLIEKMVDYKEIYTKNLRNNNYAQLVDDFQIISPMKKRDLGVYAINNMVQSILNPNNNSNEFRTYNSAVRVGDKVINTKNTFLDTISLDKFNSYSNIDSIPLVELASQKIFNGQIGVVIAIENNNCAIAYPNENYVVIYDIEVARSIVELAYCITIHKSQGSQYNTCYIPMIPNHKLMLNNQLLYTAVTRAKNMLYIIGYASAFEYACKNNKTTKRYTTLDYLSKN